MQNGKTIKTLKNVEFNVDIFNLIIKSKKTLTFYSSNVIIFLVVSKTKITNPIWNAEVSELADEQD